MNSNKLTFLWLIIAITVALLTQSILIGLLLFVVAAIVINWRKEMFKKLKLRNEHMESLRKEAKEYVDMIRNNKSLIAITSPIFLNPNEHLFLYEASEFSETRAIRHSTGGFGSVRVAKRFSLGGWSGSSESSQEWRTLDTGKLFITDKKMLFMGAKENRTIPIEKIVAVDVFRDGFKISIDSRAKGAMFKVSNPYVWGVVINILKQVKDPLNLEGVNLDVSLN